MSKTASEIADRALTLVDEQVTTILNAATTESSIRDIALEILPEVCRDLVKELPYELKRYLATTVVLVSDPLTDGELQTDYLKQKVAFTSPADFWELVSIKLVSWARPVTKYILIDSEEYVIQNNPFTRSGEQNPTVAVSNGSFQNNGRIECFSIIKGNNPAVSIFEYVQFTDVPDDSGNDWPDELFDETTKALASQLDLIKDRLEKGAIRGQETLTAIEQHE
jgi:hypothetical protein